VLGTVAAVIRGNAIGPGRGGAGARRTRAQATRIAVVRRTAALTLGAAGALVTGVAWAPAAEPVVRLEAEAFTVTRGSGGAYADRTAAKRRALVMRAGASARRRIHAEAADELVVRVQRGRCRRAPQMTVRVDGRRALQTRVRGRGWTEWRGRAAIAAGSHDFTIDVARPAGQGRCAPELRVDSLTVERSRVTVGPGPRPQPEAQARSPLLSFPRPVALGSALRWDVVRAERRYRDTFVREYASLTPENEMKWLSLQPERGHFSFATADAIVDFAQTHRKLVRGHTLVWGFQLPRWVTATDWTREELLRVMQEHITTVVGRYRGRIAEWDVVNEPLAADGSLARNVWLDVIGPDYVEHALRFAHAADPAAKLFVNEIAAEHVSTKAEGLVRLADDLRSRGVPLHAIGLQNHANLAGYPRRERLAALMRRFAALGLEVQITEMDVGTALGSGSRLQRSLRQADVYREAAAACNDVAACTRLTTWGFTDRHSWIGTPQRALPFGSDYLPKPAYVALRTTLAPR